LIVRAGRGRGEHAEGELGNRHHEGIYDPAVAAVPFLLEILADPLVPDRRPACRLLDLIVDNTDHPEPRESTVEPTLSEPTLGELAAARSRWCPPDGVAEMAPDPVKVAAYAAIRAGVPTLLTLLRDGDPELRAGGPAAGLFPGEWSAMAPVLAGLLAVEEVPSLAAALCATAGRAGRFGGDRIVAAVARWLGQPGRFVHRAALSGLARCNLPRRSAALRAWASAQPPLF
jgi:hypothetical protein